jgi:hypothetical protein
MRGSYFLDADPLLFFFATAASGLCIVAAVIIGQPGGSALPISGTHILWHRCRLVTVNWDCCTDSFASATECGCLGIVSSIRISGEALGFVDDRWMPQGLPVPGFGSWG